MSFTLRRRRGARASPASPAAARRRRRSRWSGSCRANARIRKGSRIELFGIDLVPKTEDQLRRYRWREVSIVFQGAMNALNPVRRDRRADRRADRDPARRVEGARLNSAPASCSSWSGSPASARPRYPHELSGGMRQRAMIAMALACDPAIVIGDEPTTALDVMVQAQILELLERLRRELASRMILITHDLSVIAETCDRRSRYTPVGSPRKGPFAVLHRATASVYAARLGAFPNIRADQRTSLETVPGSPPDLRVPPPGCRFHPRCPAAGRAGPAAIRGWSPGCAGRRGCSGRRRAAAACTGGAAR